MKNDNNKNNNSLLLQKKNVYLCAGFFVPTAEMCNHNKQKCSFVKLNSKPKLSLSFSLSQTHTHTHTHTTHTLIYTSRVGGLLKFWHRVVFWVLSAVHVHIQTEMASQLQIWFPMKESVDTGEKCWWCYHNNNNNNNNRNINNDSKNTLKRVWR